MTLRVLVAGAVLGQPMGGVQRHNAELLPRAARLLEAEGGGLVVLEGRVRLPRAWRDRVPRVESDVPYQPPWRRWASEGRAILRAARAAVQEGRPYDLLHTAHLPVPRTPLRYTLTVHDLRDLEPGSARSLRRLAAPRLYGEAVRQARTVVTVSRTVQADLEQRFQPRKVAVVPNAADHLEILPRDPAAASGPLLHIGHVERRKNLELLLRVLALDPALPRLALAGASKAGEAERLLGLARELGVRDRVDLLGPVAEECLPELFAQASCVVLPSSLEGFGLGVVEAQRARVPLAVSTAGALREVAGEDVPCFAPDDPAAALLAVRAALETPAATLEERAAHAERFSWQRSAELLVEAWREAAG